jgi:hypothetical protein
MTPKAPQGTTLQEYRCTYPGAVVHGKTLDIEDDALHGEKGK